jgi:hypothetical protein
MIGDITWMHLFGEYIDLSHAHEMISIADLDSGDLISEEHHKEQL